MSTDCDKMPKSSADLYRHIKEVFFFLLTIFILERFVRVGNEILNKSQIIVSSTDGHFLIGYPYIYFVNFSWASFKFS